MTQESRLAIVIDSRSAEQRASDLKTVLDHLEKSGSKATVTMRETGDSAKSMGDKSKGAAQSVGEMATALASVVSVGKLWSQVEKSAFAAGRYEQLGIIMETLGRNAGYSRYELAGLQKELEATGISMSQSRQVISRMIQAQMDLSQATQLARLAQDAATIGDISSSEALERLIYGIQTAQTEILRNIGITVNFEQAYKDLASQLGKTAANLSEQEKLQARVNIVMGQGDVIAGAYERSMENANKQMGSMARHADNLAVNLGQAYQPAFATVIETMTDGLKLANENAGALSAGLAGVTAATAVATTGVLTLTAGVSALRVAASALVAHPVVLALSLMAGAAAAAYVSISDVGRGAISSVGDVDALTRSMGELNHEFLQLTRSRREQMLMDLEEQLRGLQSEVDNSIAKLREMSESAADWAAMPDGMRPVYESLRDNILAVAGANIDASAKAEILKATIQSIEGSVPTDVYEQLMKIVLAAVTGSEGVGELAARIAELREQLDAPIQQRPIRVSPSGSDRSSAKKDAGQRYIEQMRERIALLGKETEYEQLLARVASGALTFRTEKQREVAEMLAKQLDDTQKQIEMEEVLRDLREQQSTTQMQFMRELEAFGQGERVRQLNADLAKVEDRYRGIIEARRNSPLGLSDEELTLIRESLQTELDIVRGFHEQKLALQGDWTLGAAEAFRNYVDNARNVAGQVETIFTNAFSGLENTIVDFVKTGELDLRGLLAAVTEDILRMFVRMGIQMAANAVLGKTLGASATAASVAMGATTAAAWAPAAAMASLASFGGNSVPAMAGISSTVGLAQGLALVGMAHEGIDSVPKTGTWLLEKGERVTTQKTSDRLDATLARIEAGQHRNVQSSGVTINLIENRDRAGQVEERISEDGEQEVDLFVADIRGDGRRARVLEHTYGLRRVGR